MKIIVLVLLLFTASAVADDKRHHNSDNNTVVDASSVNSTAVKGDSTKSLGLGFGHSLGDVDINQCLGSVSKSNIIWASQKLVINWPCMAEVYLKYGSYELAAMALCNTEILDEFESESDCEAAHDFTPPKQEVPTSGPSMDEIQAAQVQVAHVEEEFESLEQRVARIERDKTKQREYAQFTIERLENDDER